MWVCTADGHCGLGNRITVALPARDAWGVACVSTAYQCVDMILLTRHVRACRIRLTSRAFTVPGVGSCGCCEVCCYVVVLESLCLFFDKVYL